MARSRTVGSSEPISCSAARIRRTASSRPRPHRILSRTGGSGGGGLGGGLGGVGLTLPAGRMGGGGLVVILLLVLLNQCAGVGPDVLGGSSASGLDASRFSTGGGDTGRYASCQTGEDANN